ncbi:glycosyltransferase family 2 protein [Sphingobacterium griseoflavum]|nr:glycosyltransferase family 2 protein [Sphingobacterium griseoflavum]
MQADFTIIIPVYNEAESLPRLFQKMQEYINTAHKSSIVLLVNDGSKDESLAMIREHCANNPAFKYLSFDRNYGLSAAIKAGFDYVYTPWTGYIDADLQTDPRDFNLLFEQAADFDLVTGARRQRKDSFTKRLSSKLANKIRRFFTHDGMDDTGCPLKIIRTEYAKRIPMFSGLHRFLPAMILLQEGRVQQVTVRHYPRMAGKSKFTLWNRLLGPLQDCFAYLWMRKKYINYKISEDGSK